MSQPWVWTIGHSNHPLGRFSDLLRENGIEFIVDVRSYPYSGVAPHFGREDLRESLHEVGLGYLFLGEALGGRPADGSHYDEDGRARYDLMAQEPGFKHGIDALLRGARQHRLALMCSEGRPEHCHRRLLVGRVLTMRGAALCHVMPDGSRWEEYDVQLPEVSQTSLFGQNEPLWRSSQSVSRRRRLSTSSAA